MLKIISRIDVPPQPLDGLIGYLVNALSTLDLSDKAGNFESSPFFPKLNPNCNVDKLINVLDAAVRHYETNELEIRIVPLIQLLITIYEQAPEGPRKYMEWLLLPEDQDRSVPIGRSDTLSSKLLTLSTTPSVHLKTAISELYFVLSGKNAKILTKNIGYGFAAGFLASRGIEIPQDASEGFATNQSNINPAFNPITGQRWDAEPQDTGPAMTQEEREREAERLFVLFERYGNPSCLHNPGTNNLIEPVPMDSSPRIPSPKQCEKEDSRSFQTMPTVISIRRHLYQKSVRPFSRRLSLFSTFSFEAFRSFSLETGDHLWPVYHLSKSLSD